MINVQILDHLGGKVNDALVLFRHLMVDLIVATSFGYRLGALSKWALDVGDPLSTAINDFPKRGILVSASYFFSAV